jgi:hypothetical protein
MPFTKYANLDFDQIKDSIKSYLRANSKFTDFDFEGSNFSVLIDTLAYNTYITAFNSNMIVNESFLDSATLRENVVSLARNIGYVPKSTTAAKATISFQVTGIDSNISSLTLKEGIVCVGSSNETNYTYSTPENITVPVVDNTASFTDIVVYEGTFLSKKFTVDQSLKQKFILDNQSIDTSTISVFVSDTSELGVEYALNKNIFNIDSNSLVFFIQEVQDEKYEIFFGDGFIGKKIADNSTITAKYIVTNGEDGNGASNFTFAGSLLVGTANYSGGTVGTITTLTKSQGGSSIESINSIKYFAPKIYSSQYRAVTGRDYETLVKTIYPDTESVSIVGGEELDPPEFGTVVIAIKPKNGTFVSDFFKERILSQLKQYTISGINQRIVDLKVLYVELNSSIYFDYSKASNEDSLKTKVMSSLTEYSKSDDLNSFGGRLKYSKVLQTIDNTDSAITSNITKVVIRRDLKPSLNQFAQYELCFGNEFHINPEGRNIKSTGFKISGESETVYLTDIPNPDKKTGVLSIVKPISGDDIRVIIKSAGTVDYKKGEVLINTINIISTSLESGVVEVQAFPESNDVIGLKDLYVSMDISKSKINMVRDVIASGDEISGTKFVRDFYTSSYSNGILERK